MAQEVYLHRVPQGPHQGTVAITLKGTQIQSNDPVAQEFSDFVQLIRIEINPPERDAVVVYIAPVYGKSYVTARRALLGPVMDQIVEEFLLEGTVQGAHTPVGESRLVALSFMEHRELFDRVFAALR